MLPTDTIRGTIWQAAGCSIMARILGAGGLPVNQASVLSITRTIFPPGCGAPSSGTLDPTDVIFDELQMAGWGQDETGYNFRDPIPGESLSLTAGEYGIEYQFVPVDGEPFLLCARINALSHRGAGTTLCRAGLLRIVAGAAYLAEDGKAITIPVAPPVDEDDECTLSLGTRPTPADPDSVPLLSATGSFSRRSGQWYAVIDLTDADTLLLHSDSQERSVIWDLHELRPSDRPVAIYSNMPGIVTTLMARV